MSDFLNSKERLNNVKPLSNLYPCTSFVMRCVVMLFVAIVILGLFVFIGGDWWNG